MEKNRCNHHATEENKISWPGVGTIAAMKKLMRFLIQSINIYILLNMDINTITKQYYLKKTDTKQKITASMTSLEKITVVLGFKLGRKAAMFFEFLQTDPAKVPPNPQACTLCNDLSASCHQERKSTFPRMFYKPG